MKVEPITEEDLRPVCTFLNRYFQPSTSVSEWEAGLRSRWCRDAPNHGFMLLDDAGEIAGVIGGIYADRLIDGELHRVCNISSWYVLPAHRSSTLKMVLALLKQKGMHFTNFSPTEAAAEVLERLKFRRLDPTYLLVPNVPTLPSHGRVEVVTGPDEIERRLEGAARDLFRDHRDCRPVEHLAVASERGVCHVVYRRTRSRGVRMIDIRHASDPAVLGASLGPLLRHFLLRRAALLTGVEARFIVDPPAWALRSTTAMPKLVRAVGLPAEAIDNAYSELMCFDM